MSAPKPTRIVEDEGVIEWSRSCRDWQTDADVPRRMFVTVEGASSCIDVTECQVTSDAETARRLVGGERSGIILSMPEARWLLEALRLAVEENERRGWKDEALRAVATEPKP